MVKLAADTVDERSIMKEFWTLHSHEASVEEMMLDSQAHIISRKDTPEILSYLPSLKGKRVLELGAGIGRFTSLIGQTAQEVVAVDFMQNFIDENAKHNADLTNCEFVCADALSLDFAPGSFDVVFSNWLLMYLSDEEVSTLADRILNWLAPGGYVFFRESCFHQSGNAPRELNPTHYRNPEVYEGIFGDSVSKEGFFYELDSRHTVDVYIKLKNNPNQRCWLFRKAAGTLEQSAEFQEFLDKKQYSINGITRYERVFGAGFVSTGGLETTEEFVKTLDLQPGEFVLDVGHGIGGGDFYMARTYGVRVQGIDLSCNMTQLARERCTLEENAGLDVHFDICDVTVVNFPPESFDVIYSRDTLLHIEDKETLFASFYRWLRPGGRLLISDYCCGPKEHTPAFKEYVKQRGYYLLTVEQYGKVLEKAGFASVKAEDRTDQFVSVLERELGATCKAKDSFVRDFSEEDYNALISGWEGKVERCAAGDQKWGLFSAKKC